MAWQKTNARSDAGFLSIYKEVVKRLGKTADQRGNYFILLLVLHELVRKFMALGTFKQLRMCILKVCHIKKFHHKSM